MLDVNGMVAHMERRSSTDQGYAAEEIIGRPFSIFYPADVRAGWLTRLKVAAEGQLRRQRLACTQGRYDVLGKCHHHGAS
jgi:hypothetical protein